MLEHGAPQDAEKWILELMVLPTFDKPGKESKARIMYSSHGEVLLSKDQAVTETLLKAVKEKDSELHSLSPTEKPTEMYKLQGALVPVGTLFAEALRSMGGQRLGGRAPRGNMVRQLGGGARGRK
eukprot:5682882-Pyramimonas_sp.AAC.1